MGGTQAGAGLSVLNGQMDELAVYDLRALTNVDTVSARLSALATNHYRAALTTNAGSVLATDVRAVMAGRATSLYVRHEFVLSNATGFNELVLRVKYVDGFVAWLNGARVAGANAPDPAAFDSTALTNRSPAEGTQYRDLRSQSLCEPPGDRHQCAGAAGPGQFGQRSAVPAQRRAHGRQHPCETSATWCRRRRAGPTAWCSSGLARASPKSRRIHPACPPARIL